MNEQYLVIGTAGHIDHGKTSLVKALTNIDPTRLLEEKQRHITIDLGFSYLKVDNKAIGIIDLPGHEKFISNMIVGSSNIDMILFVIAADDGIMPQTVEHFEIISLLKIKHAIIVINKSDLVTKQVLDQRQREVKDFFSKTPFENSPIITTSIFNEKSTENLKQELINYIKTNDFKQQKFDIFRMAIDRSFSMQGIGTVVTGTSQGKELFINEQLQIYPSNHIVKVKNIQNHNINVPSIHSGQRAALQLSKVTKEQVERGDIIASVNSLKPSRYIDVIIDVLKSSKPIKNNQLIRLFHQTKEYIGRIKNNTPTIKPGTKQYVTIALQEDIYAINGDLGIIRFFSPIKTIAGIEIINILDEKPPIDGDYYIQYIDDGFTHQIINYLNLHTYANHHQILSLVPKKEELEESLHELLDNELVKVFTYNQKDCYILNDNYLQIKNNIISCLTKFHEENPLLLGMITQDLYHNSKVNIDVKIFKALLGIIYEIKTENGIIALSNFNITYTNEQKKRKNSIMTTIKHNGFNLYSFDELYNKFNQKEDKEIIQALINEKILLIINSNHLILDRMYQQALTFLDDDIIEISSFKEKTNCSRKYCVMLLEHFDKEQITKRVESYRIKLKK